MRLVILELAILTILTTLLSAATLPVTEEPQNVEEVIRRLDELYRSKTSYADVEMEIVTPHWQRTLRMKVWSKGKDRSFIRILAPAREEGVATLRIGNEMWNYLPRAGKVIKIPPSMMMSSWMGSDFTNDDLVKEFSLLDDYHHELVHPEDAQPGLVYVALTPKEGLPIVWGKIVAAVTETDLLPVWEKYYDERGNVMRTIDFKDVERLGGRLIPSVLEVIPLDKEGHKTLLHYLSAEFDVELPDDIFSLRNLRSRD